MQEILRVLINLCVSLQIYSFAVGDPFKTRHGVDYEADAGYQIRFKSHELWPGMCTYLSLYSTFRYFCEIIWKYGNQKYRKFAHALLEWAFNLLD